VPFKKTKEGWEYDLNGSARIKSSGVGLYSKPIPKIKVLDQSGHPVDADENYWRKLIEEANRKEFK